MTAWIAVGKLCGMEMKLWGRSGDGETPLERGRAGKIHGVGAIYLHCALSLAARYCLWRGRCVFLLPR